MPPWTQLLIVFGVAFGGALLFVPLSAAIGAAVGGSLVDQPRPGEVQRRPISRTGGYGIIAAFFFALVVSLPFIQQAQDRFLVEYVPEIGLDQALPRVLNEYSRLAGLALGAAFLVPFAVWDDRKRLPPLPQLIAQIGCAIIPYLFGVRLGTFHNPLGGDIYLYPVLGLPLTVLWIVGMINALNWLDTMDGLAGGVSGIGGAILFVASLALGQRTIAFLPLALAGACLGFLVWNFPPARIFMGTGGSMFLGYALGVISLIGGAKIATAVLVLGLPILDAALVIIGRLLAGRSPMRGGDDRHLVHRLLKAGLSVRRIVLLVYTLTALFGLLSVALSKGGRFYAFAAVALVIGGLSLSLWRRNASASDAVERGSEA